MTKSSVAARQTRVQGVRNPLWIRPDSTDEYCLKQIFVNRDYQFDLPVEPNVIFDAGANVGYASVFFAEQYPNAKIFSIETEASNFELLERNVQRYENVVPIHAALWHSSERVSVTDPELGSWAFRTESAREANDEIEQVRGTTVGELISKYGLTKIDILKVDIEGAEKPVFEASSAWIEYVQMIVVELHDRFTPGCTEAFDAATQDGFPRRWWQGENVCVAR